MPLTPAAPRPPEEQARLDEELIRLFEDGTPFNQVLGLKVETLYPCTMRLTMQPQLVGNTHYGRLHGGVISAVLDAVGGNALNVEIAQRHADESVEKILQRSQQIGTIDLRIDYLRPGVGRHFIGSAEILRLGRRVASVHLRLVTDAGVLVAAGTGTYVVS